MSFQDQVHRCPRVGVKSLNLSQLSSYRICFDTVGIYHLINYEVLKYHSHGGML